MLRRHRCVAGVPTLRLAGAELKLTVGPPLPPSVQVDQPLEGMCNDAASYCGVRGQLYPDKQPMGFPFDRTGRQGVDSLRSFLTRNMFIQDVTVKFQDRIEAPANRNVTAFQG